MITRGLVCALAISLTLPRSTSAAVEASASASAEAPTAKLALRAPQVTGELDTGALPGFVESLGRGLARGAFAVALPEEAEAFAKGSCEGRGCAAEISAGTGASYVLLSKISVEDRDFAVHLELLDAAGVALASSDERCELCGLAEVGALLEAQGARLRAKLEDLIKGPPVLVISTTPPGAMVMIDNQVVGATPLERVMNQGDHVVAVIRDGYVTEARDVTLVEGVRSNLEFTLRRTPEFAKVRKLGWAALAVGVPVIAGGVGLLVIDGSPARGRCDGENVDANGNCKFIYNTDWTGALTMTAGGVLATIGVMLLLRTQDRRVTRTKKAVSVEAGISPTGVVLYGRF